MNETRMGMTRSALAVAAITVGALPADARAAAAEVPGVPLIATVALVAGLSLALAGWLILRRRVAAAVEARSLRRDRARLGAVLGASPDAYYAWHTGGGETCSRRLAEWCGTTADEVAGLSLLARGFDAEDFAALEQAVSRLRANDTPFSLTLRAADGARSFSARGVSGAIGEGEARSHVLWLSDVTEQRAHAAQLAETATETAAELDRLAEILETAPFAVWRRDDDLGLTWCNKAYADSVEAGPADAVAGPGMELVSAGAPGRARALAERARASATAESEVRHVVVGGQRRALKIVEVPLGPGQGLVGFARDVTDAEEAAAELERHVDAHQEVLESLTTPIVIYGPDKRLKFFNSAYAKMFGLDEEWLASEPLHGDMLEALRERRRLPEQADFPAFKKARLDLYTSLIEPLEDILHLPDGTTYRMHISPHPFGGLLHLFDDVTDRLELERARNTLIAVQRATLDNLHEGIAVFGADGRLKLFNSSYARIWQIDEDLLAGEPHVSEVAELARPLFHYGGDWESLKALVVARATDRTPRFKRLERPDGSVVDYACVPLPDGNMLNTYLDVTDTVRIERALRERNEALETADRLKSEFIANVSYELRTPLNTVIGFAEILTNEYFGALNPRQKEYSDGILDSSHHLLDLINDILDLASIEAGRMVLEPSSFDLHAALASVLAITREQATKGNLSVEFDCPTDIGFIEADERRLKQVIFNMMSNAIKFTASRGTITLGARRHERQVELWVADSGVGIPPDEQQRVFTRFHKTGAAQDRKPGAGLGLSLVKSFIELHGGHVELESRPDVGTRVACYLPTRTAVPRAVAAGGD